MTPPTPGDEAILEDLGSADDTPAAIAARHGMTLTELTAWASRDATLEMLARVRRLADDRAALAISRARVAAAHALRRLALDTENPETARRACVDLLKLDPGAVGAPPDSPAASPSTHDSESIRDLLERLDALGPGATPA